MAQKALRKLTVSESTTLIKVVLEETLPSRMVVAGEISSFKRHYSGHCYFSLKDTDSVLPCVMWRSKADAIKFTPQDGMAVLATGHVDIRDP